jgi:hypothetical protein
MQDIGPSVTEYNSSQKIAFKFIKTQKVTRCSSLDVLGHNFFVLQRVDEEALHSCLFSTTLQQITTIVEFSGARKPSSSARKVGHRIVAISGGHFSSVRVACFVGRPTRSSSSFLNSLSGSASTVKDKTLATTIQTYLSSPSISRQCY